MDTATAATIESLKQQLDEARAYIDGQDVRSDYRNVTEMRAALDAARAVKAERERCCKIINDTAPADYLAKPYIKAIQAKRPSRRK